MSVDIAFGIVKLGYEDISIPGKVALVWDRHYSTALLSESTSMLGYGWTSRYFATLTKREDDFEFRTTAGAVEIFPDPEATVARAFPSREQLYRPKLERRHR
jgi:hypothetical protein